MNIYKFFLINILFFNSVNARPNLCLIPEDTGKLIKLMKKNQSYESRKFFRNGLYASTLLMGVSGVLGLKFFHNDCMLNKCIFGGLTVASLIPFLFSLRESSYPTGINPQDLSKQLSLETSKTLEEITLLIPPAFNLNISNFNHIHNWLEKLGYIIHDFLAEVRACDALLLFEKNNKLNYKFDENNLVKIKEILTKIGKTLNDFNSKIDHSSLSWLWKDSLDGKRNTVFCADEVRKRLAGKYPLVAFQALNTSISAELISIIIDGLDIVKLCNRISENCSVKDKVIPDLESFEKNIIGLEKFKYLFIQIDQDLNESKEFLAEKDLIYLDESRRAELLAAEAKKNKDSAEALRLAAVAKREAASADYLKAQKHVSYVHATNDTIEVLGDLFLGKREDPRPRR